MDLQEETREAASREKVQHIVQAWRDKEQSRPRLQRAESKIASPAQLNSLKRQMNPSRITFPLVTYRSALQIFRNWDILLARTTQVISIGAIFALFFAPLQKNYEGVSATRGNTRCLVSVYVRFVTDFAIQDPKQCGPHTRSGGLVLRRDAAGEPIRSFAR